MHSRRVREARKAFKLRFDPKAEEYGEDIVPFDFCSEIEACVPRKESMDRTFGHLQAKEKYYEKMREML